jgi:hypothetical protein
MLSNDWVTASGFGIDTFIDTFIVNTAYGGSSYSLGVASPTGKRIGIDNHQGRMALKEALNKSVRGEPVEP